MTETILWGVRVGQPDWQEEIITNQASRVDKAREWALKNGFDRLRVATIDTDTPPDFASCVK